MGTNNIVWIFLELQRGLWIEQWGSNNSYQNKPILRCDCILGTASDTRTVLCRMFFRNGE